MQLRLSICLLVVAGAVITLYFGRSAPAPSEGNDRPVVAASMARTSPPPVGSQGSADAENTPAPAITASPATAGISMERQMQIVCSR